MLIFTFSEVIDTLGCLEKLDRNLQGVNDEYGRLLSGAELEAAAAKAAPGPAAPAAEAGSHNTANRVNPAGAPAANLLRWEPPGGPLHGSACL